jgi:hypothetical protein
MTLSFKTDPSESMAMENCGEGRKHQMTFLIYRIWYIRIKAGFSTILSQLLVVINSNNVYNYKYTTHEVNS